MNKERITRQRLCIEAQDDSFDLRNIRAMLCRVPESKESIPN